MAVVSANKADFIKEQQAINPADIISIHYAIGTILCVGLFDDMRGGINEHYATVVGDYEHYINVEIEGNAGTYVRSLNKVDIIRKDSVLIRRVK